MINNVVNNSVLCGCKRPPRMLVDNFAICTCDHLIYRPSRGIGPMTPWDSWNAEINPAGRKELVARAKRRIGPVAAVDPTNVQDAVDVARQINDNQFADDLEYEQWVARL